MGPGQARAGQGSWGAGTVSVFRVFTVHLGHKSVSALSSGSKGQTSSSWRHHPPGEEGGGLRVVPVRGERASCGVLLREAAKEQEGSGAPSAGSQSYPLQEAGACPA